MIGNNNTNIDLVKNYIYSSTEVLNTYDFGVTNEFLGFTLGRTNLSKFHKNHKIEETLTVIKDEEGNRTIATSDIIIMTLDEYKKLYNLIKREIDEKSEIKS